MTVQAERQAAD